MKINRLQIYEKYNGHCAYCGDKLHIKDMQVDHIIPQFSFLQHINNKKFIPTFLNHLTKDDVNHYDNLNPACRVCNKWKSSHHLGLFRSEIESQINRLNNYSSNYRMAKKYGQIIETHTLIEFYFEKIKQTF
jgi:5-methylcytosine-specific restriction endonuclease McrA